VTLDGDRMAALRQRFAAAAGDQADRIEALLASGDVEAARAVAHGLAGRSGMFGYAALGELARLVDEAEGAEFAGRARDLLAALRALAQEG
jgi:HPt (histidine-containing phosphotransfer) domain-containing protein